MKSIVVQLDEKKVTIEKLPLFKYSEVLKALDELPKKLVGLTGLTNDEILKQIPQLVRTNTPEVLQILSIATSISVEELNQLGLDEVVDIAIGVYQVNNYQGIYEKIKKAVSPPVIEGKTLPAK